jgi:branched-chain amino acid transport system permease protein
MAVEIFAFALFAASLHLLMGLGGMVSFGHAAYFGLGAYGAALLLKWAGWPMPLAFLVAPVVAAVAAAAFGYFSVRLTSIYFAMLTLAFAQIVFAVVHQWDEVTGGDNGVLAVWPRHGYQVPDALLLGARLRRRGRSAAEDRRRLALGLALRAVRDTQASGGRRINIRALQWTAFVVAGFRRSRRRDLRVPRAASSPSTPRRRCRFSRCMVLLGGVSLRPAVAPLPKPDTVITRYTDYWQVGLGGILVVLVLAFPRGIAGVLDWRRS